MADLEVKKSVNYHGVVELGETGSFGDKIKGMFVKTMVAPSSTTLTDEQIDQIIGGVFIQGTFLGGTNPVLLPATTTDATYYYGLLFIAIEANGSQLGMYRINKTTKEIIKLALFQTFTISGEMNAKIVAINNKAYPANPSNTGTFINKMIDGTWTWSLEAPTPNVVSLNLETILAGTDVNFSCSGSGTSESPYIIMPKANIPHRYNRYQLTANTEPANDIYITLQANGLEKCQVKVTHSVAFTTHHYYVTVLDNNGNARVRVSSANTISRAIWDVSGTKFIITLDVNGDNVYYATSIA